MFSRRTNLDERLNFTEHMNSKISKCDKLMRIIKKLSTVLSRNALLRIYKSFIRPHLDYADSVYDITCIAITGGTEGKSRERHYCELELKHLTDERWFRHQPMFNPLVL